MVNDYHQNTKKDSEKKQLKDTKIFLKKKNIKHEKKAGERYQSFYEDKKEKRRKYYLESRNKLPDYIRNYFLTHKKQPLGLF